MYSKKRKSKNMETINEVLTIAQVVTLIREAGGSAQTLYSMAEDFGVLLSEPYNDGGEVFTRSEVIKWLKN
jgi:hypothetical protein